MINSEFLLTSLIVILIPGTGVIYTLSNGLTLGWKASVFAALGCTLGIVPHLLAGVFGLSFLLHMSALAFQTIKWVGVAYLMFLAWSMWKEQGKLELKPEAGGSNAWKIVWKGLLINILNPKLSLFFLAFLPQFIPQKEATPVLKLTELSLIFMGLTFLVFTAYGIFADRVRVHVVRSDRLMGRIRRGFAVAFAALGLKLAATES